MSSQANNNTQWVKAPQSDPIQFQKSQKNDATPSTEDTKTNKVATTHLNTMQAQPERQTPYRRANEAEANYFKTATNRTKFGFVLLGLLTTLLVLGFVFGLIPYIAFSIAAALLMLISFALVHYIITNALEVERQRIIV